MGGKKKSEKEYGLVGGIVNQKSQKKKEEFLKGTGKRFPFFSKQKQISTNILIENPKTQNKNESNLNLSNKKTQLKVKFHTQIYKRKKKNLPLLVPTIRVVDIWPNSFFM